LLSKGDWKLEVKVGVEETFPLCQGEDDVISMMFNWPETQRWRENFLEKK